jgi:RNA polymerase sigma-70 factor, ECF subfamily
MTSTSSRVETFNQYRPLLFSIAYRMLESASDAEDAVQESFLRWEGAPESEVNSPRSYLSAVVTRLCIDQLKSARARREVYVGQWLPEPLLTERMPEMTQTVELAESLSFAFLRLLETLNPVERAVFLLREVFDYSYEEIAGIVGKSEANCRQIVRRAQQHLREHRPRFHVSREEQEQVTQRFIEVCAGGDMDGLLNLLAPEVSLTADSGGKVLAPRNVLHGATNIAKFFMGVLRKLGPVAIEPRIAEINGQPGLLVYIDGHLDSLVLFEVEDGKIQGVSMVSNPDKLARIARQS